MQKATSYGNQSLLNEAWNSKKFLGPSSEDIRISKGV